MTPKEQFELLDSLLVRLLRDTQEGRIPWVSKLNFYGFNLVEGVGVQVT